ncbi:helix-turn-helix domain-containing protein [Dyadobacter subterraneus]|uniref:Helix-turn-helix domain-containing protein n=1 Tax=Dyadobacter subterraneus TaxID=2773304 RepID=A0ABR9WEZ6_9BACT|nr:helix-turn-helix domain-containing protein [Dyadobacter subterraneus]MBE9463501.1 helix-turn-helix domain-containing protein [Dyadobacter subterraneus]
MRKKNKSIPLNTMTDDFGGDISVERLAVNDLWNSGAVSYNGFEEAEQSHRHDRHSFFLLETGTVHLEIDFQKYKMTAPSVIYIHPDQVHRTTDFENVTVSSWAINNENLNPEYLQLLESITPAKPLELSNETFSILSETVSLFIKFSGRKSDQLYQSLLKDICNALIALVASQYLEHSKSTDKLSRFEIVNKAFREMLERNYSSIKSPAAYAQKLNISTPYLNECVKEVTGYPVTYHIQQRVILEAKRLLYYSDKSVKEISAELGYDDYPYFSRLFTKVTGTPALIFRKKNLD